MILIPTLNATNDMILQKIFLLCFACKIINIKQLKIWLSELSIKISKIEKSIPIVLNRC